MRLMFKFQIPVERGNEAEKDGTLSRAIDDLIKATNAEAAYFTMLDGERTGLIFFEEDNAARLTEINEPFMAATDAAIDIVPVLSLADLKQGL